MSNKIPPSYNQLLYAFHHRTTCVESKYCKATIETLISSAHNLHQHDLESYTPFGTLT